MSKIGFWDWDNDQLPRYHYTGAYPAAARDKEGKDAMLPDDPCFILGNYRMTLFAHVSGRYEFMTGEHGWARLNHCEKNCGWSRSLLEVLEEKSGKRAASYELAGVPFADSIMTKRSFGAGYADYEYESLEGIKVSRTLSVKPSRRLHEGNPSFLVRVKLENHGSETRRLRYREEVLANYRMVTEDEYGTEDRRVRYENHLETEDGERLAVAKISCRPEKLLILPENLSQSFTHDVFPPDLFIKAVSSEAYQSCVKTDGNAFGDLLCAEFETELPPGESRELRFVIGLSFEKDCQGIARQIEDMLEEAGVPAVEGTGAYGHLWKDRLPLFEEEKDECLRREMIWNAYVLESMATWNRYFQETYIPQGSVYAYRLGQNTSNRDHLQHSLPLMYTNPELAKSCIRFAMKHTMPDGEIRRQDIGYGYSDPGVYMESDPQLYLFMAVGEYLSVTEDTAFLDERICGYPADGGRSGTVLEFLVRHFMYLRDVVRTGRHGLVRMLNSDWSDSFFHPYSPNIYRQFAESHMNTAMALVVIPVLMDGLSAYVAEKEKREGTLEAGALARELISALGAYREELYGAFMKDMEGRTFAPRCYIGEDENPKLKFGMDTLCLEAQIFLLQMKDYPLERKKQLVQEIKERVLDMEKIGARTREIPLWDGRGHGEDGGVWFSHQGQLVLGLLTVDKKEAVKLMKKLTFHNYAEQYPDYWLGHWTFADSLESSLSEREGLYSFWVQDAFWPFCAHAHAWMLYCYYKVNAHT